MINDELFDKLNNLLGTLIQTEKAGSDFGPGGVFRSIFQSPCERRSIEEQTGLGNLQPDTQAMDHLYHQALPFLGVKLD